MPLTLYAATIPSFLQILGSVAHLVDKAEAFGSEHALAPEALIEARLAEDMLPFAYQVKSVAVHSLGAIEGVRKGVFGPDMTPPPADFAGLRGRMAETTAALEALDPAEIESFIGQPMRFDMGTFRMDFTAEDFLLSFSQPNFYFHATAAYSILRMTRVAVGKRDYLGAMRLAG